MNRPTVSTDEPSGGAAGAPSTETYCISCGESISADAEICPHCGVSQRRLPESGGPGRTADEKYCTNCGSVVNRDAELCPECGAEQTIGAGGEVDKLAAALIALFLGGLGIHKFYLGDNKMGVLYLCFFWTGIPAVLGIIEGIIYLTKSDEEFQRRYVKR
ncbi:TM2 domain-containing protein [Halorarum salinum]|uniref:TM2 domain-containing protein n=1 Tax=Halorarum salinum TaxID=2743089 RepID=A0A7D5QCE3_9EURY|nr:TM2 domain-containing protein [Halobaculum salinum]